MAAAARIPDQHERVTDIVSEDWATNGPYAVAYHGAPRSLAGILHGQPPGTSQGKLALSTPDLPSWS
jgi:hypothetical protein